MFSIKMMPDNFIVLPPLTGAQGTVTLPGSKSISNRILLLSALSQGTTEIRDVLLSDDTQRMLEALRVLGVAVEQTGTHMFTVAGCGGNFPNREAELFLGNAGTAFRPLTAVLALSGGHYQLSGVSRMHERPIGDLVDALRALGAHIDYLEAVGFPPLQIAPALLNDAARISVRGDVSSQFLTALLMALPLLDRCVTVQVEGELISKPYIGITLAMMARFGVSVECCGWQSFSIAAGSRYVSPGVIHVEGDASSASYFLAAGAIGGGPVRIVGAGSDSIQGDVRFADALALMGAQISMGPNWIEARAPASGQLQGIELDCNAIPDAAMTLAVTALYATGTTTLRNIGSWRVKETDRIAAMATELRKLGAQVIEGQDYLSISGMQAPARASSRPLSPTPNAGARLLYPEAGIDTYDDHRIAMCFSLAAFGPEGIRINDPGCVAKTFPDYFEYFNETVQAVPVIAIDGPSASGKGTVAQRVAQQLGYHYLDSGMLYRLLAMAALRDGIAQDNEAALASLAVRIAIRFDGESAWLDGIPADSSVRGEQCAAAASQVAALPAVRTALLHMQYAFRRAPGLVADGRDMASKVYPDAALKIFLTASVEARAERRYKQLKEKGKDANIAALLLSIKERDERDTLRSASPLQKAADATLLDTTTLNIGQAVEFVLACYLKKSI